MNIESISSTSFRSPPPRFRPWTRWWWPGGDVDRDELLREVRLFADWRFGGVEIQPFTAGMNPETRNDPASAIYDYDSPGYYEKLATVLEEAERVGLQVDLTMGSGWPAGGPFVPIEDNVDTLLYGEATVTRGVDMPVPPPIMPFPYAVYSSSSVLPLLRGREWTQTLSYRPELARLVCVVAAQVENNRRSPDPSVLTDTLHLRLDTAVDITEHVKDGHIQWQPPAAGEWQIIAVYTMPSGSRPLLAAVAEESYVVDPFDTEAIVRYYENWIGQHPELLAHAGKTLRALFSDSYEYFPQRHFADDLIETFRANRGYDVTPYLPAVFQPARDQHFWFFCGLRTGPDFSYGEAGPRIIHDYDLTLSDLFFKHWYAASREWIEERNLAFRQQGYNPPLDVIRAAGAATVPETEGGNELLLKRVASGGHLYGRPIISAESFVFLPQGGFSLTPEDYRQGIDLLMTSGVNQVIFHGTPYRWDAPGYGETGWSPFISPYGPTNISTSISEAESFWTYQRDVNLYASRLQTLMQAGEPDADALIYLPVFANPSDARFAPVVQTLNREGIAWEWVNDDLLLQARWTDDGLAIGKMSFQAIILPDIEALPLATAQKLEALAQAGLPIAMYGQMPTQQPGFVDYADNDRAVAQHAQSVLEQAHCAQCDNTDALARFVADLPTGAVTYGPNQSLRYIRRRLEAGATITFIRNTDAQATRFTLRIDPALRHCYWLDAASGNMYAADARDGTMRGRLPGFGSVALLSSPHPAFADEELTPGSPVEDAVAMNVISLDHWRLDVSGDDVPGGSFTATTDALGDWSQRDELRYVSSAGTYATTVTLNKTPPDVRYVLELGALHSPAEVTVNGQAAGFAIFAPYRVDVTEFISAGENQIAVNITPALYNRLLGKALHGDAEYAQFAAPGRFGPAAPHPCGLAGPVTLNAVDISR